MQKGAVLNSKIRVGFIGTGWPGRVQIAAFKHAGLTAAGICSGKIENARRIARQHDIPEVYDDWRAMIAAENIDLVSIVTPTWLHSEIAIAALQAGKQVLCEAPTLTVAEAESMLATAKLYPGQLALIDYELRYTPQRQKILELLNGQVLGKITSLHLNYCFGWNLDGSNPWHWENDLESGGGVLNLVGGHLLDQARWFAGPIEKLTAQFTTLHQSRPVANSRAHKPVSGDDQANLLLQFSNGAQGTLTISAVHPDSASEGLRTIIHGENGSLLLDRNETLWRLEKDGNRAAFDIPDAAQDVIPAEEKSAFAYGTYHLGREIKMLLSDPENPPGHVATFHDGLLAQMAIAAARRSAVENTWETIEH